MPIAVAPWIVALATSPQAAGPAKMIDGAFSLSLGKSLPRLGPAKSTFKLQAPEADAEPCAKPEPDDRGEGSAGRG